MTDKHKLSKDESKLINDFLRKSDDVEPKHKPSSLKSIFGKTAQDLGKSLNSKGVTLAHLAVKENRVDILEIIVSKNPSLLLREDNSAIEPVSYLSKREPDTFNEEMDKTIDFLQRNNIYPSCSEVTDQCDASSLGSGSGIRTQSIATTLSNDSPSIPFLISVPESSFREKEDKKTESLDVYKGMFV